MVRFGCRIVREAKAEKLPVRRLRHRAFGGVNLEPEFTREEVADALHHPMTRSFAAHVDVAIVGVAHERQAPLFQFPVQLVEDEVGEQGRKRAALRSTLFRRPYQAVLQNPGVEKRPDQLEQPLVGHPLGDARHQTIVVDPVEKLLQVDIHDPAVALGDNLLGPGDGLVGVALRAESVAVLGERRVPSLLEYLQDRLLHQPVQYCRNPKFRIPLPAW